MTQPLDLGPHSQDLFESAAQNQTDSLSDYLSDGTNTFLQSQVGAVMANLGYGGDSFNNDHEWALPISQDLTAAAPADIMPMGGLEIQQLQHVNQAVPLDIVVNNEQVEIPLETPSPPGTLDDVPLSQSSVCSDDGIPLINNWPGNYNFAYSLESGPIKKCSFSPKLNKLFVVNALEIEFKFRYDFGEVRGADMSLEAFLRYEKTDAAKFPVKRCLIHMDKERKTLEEHNGARENMEEELGLIPHFLKCSHAKAEHFQDDYSRYRVRVPLGKPQPGTDYVARNFRFDCLSSCKVDIPLRNQNPQKNPIVLVFELKEKAKVVGRVVMNLRVCSCPARDFSKEEGDLEKRTPKRKSISAPGTSGRRPAMDAAEQNLDKRAKQARLSGLIIAKLEPMTPVRGAGPDDDLFFSSQESVLSDDGIPPEMNAERAKTKYREYMAMTRYVLRLLAKGGRHNRFQTEIGKTLCKEIRRAFKSSTLYSEIHPEGGSPDSGVSPGPRPNPDY